MERIKNLASLDIQSVLEHLHKYYNYLNQYFHEPKTRFTQDYKIVENGINKLAITNWFRNVVVLDNYEMIIQRLQELFISSDYFNNNVDLHKKGEDFNKQYKDKFMYSIAIDSVRSALDILSKAIAWYFNLDEKDEVGFCWVKLIKPLKSINETISNDLNAIYKSTDFKYIKEFRDTDKHAGFGKRLYSYKVEKSKFEIVIKRADPLDFDRIDHSLCEVFNMFLEIIKNITEELKNYGLCFKSKNDVFGKIEDNGTITMLPVNA